MRPMNLALLVIDMQNEFFAEGNPAKPSLHAAVEYINGAIALFRKASAPVIIVSDIEEPTRIPGAPSFALHESIAAEPGDLRVDKRAGNAFWETDLDAQLRARSIDMLILSGFCAEYCVLNTFRGARERGWPAAILKNGIATPNQDRIRFVEDICDVISYGALEGWMGLLNKTR